MPVQPVPATRPVCDDDLLDPETSAAVLRWMETSTVPEGIARADWERWLDAGCVEPLEAEGRPVTPTMLGRWARSGSLR